MDAQTKTTSKIEKTFIFTTIVIILLSLIPLLYVAGYDIPVADDFFYSESTKSVWESTHSIELLIKEGIDTSIRFWNNWQGLYSSAFLQSFQPGIFGDKYYGITAYIMIFFIFAGMISLTTFIFMTYLDSTVLEAFFIGFVMSFYAVQYMPDISEGIYWYNGAVNYGFFWALQCFFIILFLAHKNGKKPILSLIFLFLSILLGIIIEGGNHVTGFSTILFVFGMLLYDLFIKKQKSILTDIVTLVILIAAFMLNIFSPGTVVRKNAVAGSDPVKAMISAVCHGSWRITEWTDLKIIYGILIVLPVLLKIVIRFCKNSEFEFKKPGGVAVIVPLYISALFCPPYYAMSFAGTGRLENVVYYTYIVLTVIAVVYFLGWFYRKTCSVKLWEKLTGISSLTVVISICAFIALMIGSRSNAYWAAKSVKQGNESLFVVSSNMIIEGKE